MPDSDIVNHNAQFIHETEEAVHTTSMFKIIPGSIIGLHTTNSFGLARDFSLSYKWLEGKKRGGFGGFIRDIVI